MKNDLYFILKNFPVSTLYIYTNAYQILNTIIKYRYLSPSSKYQNESQNLCNGQKKASQTPQRIY